LVSDTPHEGERLAVRRRRRPLRPARPGHERLDLAGLPVEALDDVDLRVRVFVVLVDRARRGVVAVVDVAAVGRDRRLAGVLLIGTLLGELQALATAAVIEPHLARAEGALGREVLAGDDVFAVRRPTRLVEQAEGLFGHLLRIGAVAIHDPDVVAAGAVAGEGDPFAVRAVARLHVPFDAGGQRFRFAAADGDAVDVAEEVEGDLLPIRADVDRQPRPLGD